MKVEDTPDRVEASEVYRDWVLSLIRCFTPDKPMMVGKRIMAECRKDPDLLELVDRGVIREIPMIPTW